MKLEVVIFLLLRFFFSQGNASLKTDKYAGSYDFGTSRTGNGSMDIYPETDSTILFYVQLNRGAPSYNMGERIGRVLIKSDSGSYRSGNPGDAAGCAWSFRFSKKRLTVKTVLPEYNCGFGFGVFADGVFKRRTTTVPEYYTDLDGKTIYFNTLTQEQFDNQ